MAAFKEGALSWLATQRERRAPDDQMTVALLYTAASQGGGLGGAYERWYNSTFPGNLRRAKAAFRVFEELLVRLERTPTVSEILHECWARESAEADANYVRTGRRFVARGRTTRDDLVGFPFEEGVDAGVTSLDQHADAERDGRLAAFDVDPSEDDELREQYTALAVAAGLSEFEIHSLLALLAFGNVTPRKGDSEPSKTRAAREWNEAHPDCKPRTAHHVAAAARKAAMVLMLAIAVDPEPNRNTLWAAVIDALRNANADR